LNEHWEHLQAMWERTPQSIIDNFVDKLFERRRLVLEQNGLHVDDL
jgi:hypothetical protein